MPNNIENHLASYALKSSNSRGRKYKEEPPMLRSEYQRDREKEQQKLKLKWPDLLKEYKKETESAKLLRKSLMTDFVEGLANEELKTLILPPLFLIVSNFEPTALSTSSHDASVPAAIGPFNLPESYKGKTVSLPGKSRGLVRITSVGPDASKAKVVRKWRKIKPGHKAYELKVQ